MKSRQDAGRLISSALIECKCLQVWMVKYFRQVSSVDLTTVQCILHSHVACRSGIIRIPCLNSMQMGVLVLVKYCELKVSHNL